MTKKLIEVSLPLEAINRESAREKSIRHGHPSALHLWWARRPLAAARAVIFSQMVDDPSSYVDTLRADAGLLGKAETALRVRLKLWGEACAQTEESRQSGLQAPDPGPEPTIDDVLADQERQRLFDIIEDLVKWENTTNETVLQAARAEIWKSWRRACAENADQSQAGDLFDPDKLPGFHDPFAGGGALPLEAQRLGLESYASDLNPVAVLINKAMIEIPPRFADAPPVNPESCREKPLIAQEWRGAQGLADDVRYYGIWMRDEAVKRIGHLYPKVEITTEMAAGRPDLKRYVGQKLGVISWLWARTVKSPNPAYAQVDVPLVSTFMLSKKVGKEVYIEPVIDGDGYRFTVRVGKPEDPEAAQGGTTLGKWSGFRCLMSGAPVSYDYIRGEGQAGRMDKRLMAVVVEGVRERLYLTPTSALEKTANQAQPKWIPEQEINYHPRDIKTQIYGLTRYCDLFTPRQLVAMTTLSDLVQEAREEVERQAVASGLSEDKTSLDDGGSGAAAYADAVGLYLAFALSKQADLGNSLCRWEPIAQCPRQLFGRQAIPMVWDFAEGNPLGDSSGSWLVLVDGIAKAVAKAFEFVPARAVGHACQADAGRQDLSTAKVVSTDPPYYDNIGYADLSDFFYVWLRRTLKPVFPDLFATLVVPKAQELVATPYRHGTKEKAETFFLDGMTQAMQRIAEQAHPAFPVTIYYAYKQAERQSEAGGASTGWETFLEAVLRAGLAVVGTWPMRTENSSRMMGQGYNSLASSIIIVCRKRPVKAPIATRREFVSALKTELPAALGRLQRGNIAPVDLAQASFGPGMAVFSRYAKVVETDGSQMPVRAALDLINQVLDEIVAEQEGEFDSDTRWAIAWFEQVGNQVGEFGLAETLCKAKGTSVGGMVKAGILEAKGGKVRLLRRQELDAGWDPTTDNRLTVWEMTHHLVQLLEGGESAAAPLAHQLGSYGEVARDLAYRLYLICERMKWAQEALDYNGLVVAWPQIQRLAAAEPVSAGLSQTSLEV